MGVRSRVCHLRSTGDWGPETGDRRLTTVDQVRSSDCASPEGANRSAACRFLYSISGGAAREAAVSARLEPEAARQCRDVPRTRGDGWIGGSRSSSCRARCPYHVYHQFVIRVPDRDVIRAHLANRGIGTEVYYPVPFHRQPFFAHLGYSCEAFPNADTAAREVLALPIYRELTSDRQQHVIDSLAECVA